MSYIYSKLVIVLTTEPKNMSEKFWSLHSKGKHNYICWYSFLKKNLFWNCDFISCKYLCSPLIYVTPLSLEFFNSEE